MKRQAKLIGAGVGLLSLLLSTISMTPLVSANSPGQIDGGPIYKIANLTKNSPYANPASANACDEVEYSILLHNSGYSSVTGINVSASLPSTSSTVNTSNVHITYGGGVVSSTDASATLNISSAQTVSYESGSTVLYAGNGAKISNVPDGVIGSGVNIGDLNGSTAEYLNFKAKISCETPPKPVYTCNNLNISAQSNRTVKITDFSTTATNGAAYSYAVVSWGDSSGNLHAVNPVGQTHQYGADGTYTVSATAHFSVNGVDVAAGGTQCQKSVTFKTNVPPTVTPPPVTPPTTPPATPAAPTALVNTGPGSVVALFAAATGAGMFIYRKMITRRLSQQ